MRKKILVTGASGYLAAWIVRELLAKGYIVHGTVRTLSDREKLQHLFRLQHQFPNQLKLFTADLLVPYSFDDAMSGCSMVIHTASPYFLEKPENFQEQLLLPAVDGTLNVLTSVERTREVTRVIITSSIAALYNDACDLNDRTNHKVLEDDINLNNDPHHNSYAYSKTQAEQSARSKYREQNRWQLISIHPGAIFGPSLSTGVGATSVKMMLQFLNGSFRNGVPRLSLGLVDVRDVALAHVNAALLPKVQGRYIVVGQPLRLLQMASLMRVDEAGLQNRLPRHELPKILMWLLAPMVGMQRGYVTRNVGYDIYFDNARSISELGLQYHSPEDTLNDHIKQIVSDGLLAT